MNTSAVKLRIESIIFDNSDTKVFVQGKSINNNLMCSAEMYISFSELNLLINHLQQQNPQLNISDLFEEECLSPDFSQTRFHSESIINKDVELSKFSFGSTKQIIRA